MDHAQLVRRTYDAMRDGDLGPLEAALAPDARWRAVEDGPWNCENCDMILAVMAAQQVGSAGTIEDLFDVGERVVVAFRPDSHDPDAWPLDDGIRHVVVTLRDGLITELKGCATRADALAYAQAT